MLRYIPKTKYDHDFSPRFSTKTDYNVKHYSKALSITRLGGVFVFCGIMFGSDEGVLDEGVLDEEPGTFTATNMMNNWPLLDNNVNA